METIHDKVRTAMASVMTREEVLLWANENYRMSDLIHDYEEMAKWAMVIMAIERIDD